MQKASERYSFSYQGQTIAVHPKKVGRDLVYALYFEDGRLPLVLTLAKTNEGGSFWTSLPEGRQPEAEVFGPLVELYQPVSKLPVIPTKPSVKPLSLFD